MFADDTTIACRSLFTADSTRIGLSLSPLLDDLVSQSSVTDLQTGNLSVLVNLSDILVLNLKLNLNATAKLLTGSNGTTLNL